MNSNEKSLIFDGIPMQNVPDIFTDEFDTTWAMGYDNWKSEWTVIPPEKKQLTKATMLKQGFFLKGHDDKEVIYNFNNEKFRSDDFISDHNGKKHILFSGCSETEGVGSPLNTVWAKILYDKVSKDIENSGYFNLGRSGYGWQKIITSFMIYTKKYGFPDYFFILMPNIGRFYKWEIEMNHWVYMQNAIRNPFFKLDISDEQQSINFSKEREVFLDWVISWKLFVEYCKSNNVKLVYSSWHTVENKNLQQVNHMFPELFLMDEDDMAKKFEEKRPGMKTDTHDLRRRDGHHGILYHEYWAERFYEEIKSRNLIND